MTATVEQPALAAALGRIRGAVESRSTIPILSHVLIACEAGRMHLTASDLDIEITADIEAAIEAAIEAEFRTTARADMLTDIVKRVPKGAQIRLTLEEHGDLRLRWGRNSASLRTLPALGFPAMGACGAEMAEIALGTLAGALAFCSPAISTEETRYYLNGVYLHRAGEAGTLRAVATDGNKLARADTGLAWPAAWPEAGGILPRKTVGLLTNAEGDARLGMTGTRLRIEAADWTLTSKLIDGRFPDYTRVIPTPGPGAQRLTLDRAALAEAVQIAMVPARSDRKSPAVKLDPEEGGVTLSGMSADYGSATLTIAAQVEGGAWPLGFNGRYLADLLAVLNDGPLTITQDGDAANPALITQPDTARALVLMPMRIA